MEEADSFIWAGMGVGGGWAVMNEDGDDLLWTIVCRGLGEAIRWVVLSKSISWSTKQARACPSGEIMYLIALYNSL